MKKIFLLSIVLVVFLSSLVAGATVTDTVEVTYTDNCDNCENSQFGYRIVAKEDSYLDDVRINADSDVHTIDVYFVANGSLWFTVTNSTFSDGQAGGTIHITRPQADRKLVAGAYYDLLSWKGSGVIYDMAYTGNGAGSCSSFPHTRTNINVTTQVRGSSGAVDNCGNIDSFTTTVVTASQPSASINLPHDADHNNVPLTVNFTTSHEDTTTYSMNATLYVNGTDNKLYPNKQNITILHGTVRTLSNASIGNGHHSWLIEVCDNRTTARQCSNTTARTYIYDNVNPVITWYNPSGFNVSHSNFTALINITDTNLYRVNYTIYYPNFSVAYNNFTDLLNNSRTWFEVRDASQFEEEFNYTIEVSATDSHTLGDLAGLSYEISDEYMRFFKGDLSKKIYVGNFTDSTFYFYNSSEANNLNISFGITNNSGEYNWGMDITRPENNINLGFAIEKTNVDVINSSIGHVVWYHGMNGWYFDFEDIVDEGFDLNYAETDNYHVFYTNTMHCLVDVGEICQIGN